MKNMPKVTPRRPHDKEHPDGYVESDVSYVFNNIAAAVMLLDNEVERADAPYKELEAHQWGGLARDLIMCLHLNCLRGNEIHLHLRRAGTPIPVWLSEYIADAPHVPTKGDTVCAIVRAALTAQED